MDEVTFTITDDLILLLIKALNITWSSWTSLCRNHLTDAMYELPSSDDKILEMMQITLKNIE
jgi:ATP-dependent Clp protease ATP-binding subunit ClpX